MIGLAMLLSVANAGARYDRPAAVPPWCAPDEVARNSVIDPAELGSVRLSNGLRRLERLPGGPAREYWRAVLLACGKKHDEALAVVRASAPSGPELAEWTDDIREMGSNLSRLRKNYVFTEAWTGAVAWMRVSPYVSTAVGFNVDPLRVSLSYEGMLAPTTQYGEVVPTLDLSVGEVPIPLTADSAAPTWLHGIGFTYGSVLRPLVAPEPLGRLRPRLEVDGRALTGERGTGVFAITGALAFERPFQRLAPQNGRMHAAIRLEVGYVAVTDSGPSLHQEASNSAWIGASVGAGYKP